MKIYRRLICAILIFTIVISVIVIPTNANGKGATEDASGIVNLYDAEKSKPGIASFIDTENADSEFHSSHAIEVTAGDTITIGPILRNNYWFIRTYDANKSTSSTAKVTREGCVEEESICNNAKIYTYTVPEGVSYIRVVNAHMFYDCTLVTKNYVFTGEEYFEYMDKEGINVDFLRPTNTESSQLVNIRGELLEGRYDASGNIVDASDYRSLVYSDIKERDFICFGSTYKSQAVFVCFLNEKGEWEQEYNSTIIRYEDLGGGYATYAYRVRPGIKKVSITFKTDVYEAGQVLVTKNQSFTGKSYREKCNIKVVNLYDAEKAASGWVPDTYNANVTSNSEFHTTHAIEVTTGDTITIGPILNNGRWFAKTYDSNGNVIGTLRKEACVESGTICNNAKIYTYTVPEDVAYIRVMNSHIFYDCMMITKNCIFTADEYFSHMDAAKINVDFLRPTGDAAKAENLFSTSPETLEGFYNGSGEFQEGYAFASRQYTDFKERDVIYFAAALKSQGYHITIQKEDGSWESVSPSAALLYEDLGRGFATYVYRVRPGTEKVNIILGIGLYEDGLTFVTKNQPFTGESYRKLFGIDLNKDFLDENSPLNGLTALFIGDSITRGSHDKLSYSDDPNNNVSWAGGIASATGLISTNAAVSGARISYYDREDNPGLWIFNQYQEYIGQKFDMIVMHGGVNDAGHKKGIGTPLPIDSTREELESNKDTYAGGLQWLFHNVKAEFSTSTLFFIANYRLDGCTSGYRNDMSAYFSMAEKICEMYDVHFIDLYNNEELNDRLDSKTTKYIHDTIHPNRAGYEIITPYIQAELERVMCKEHSFTVTKNDDTHHWKECSYCESVDEGTKAEHDLGEFTEVDGVRTGNCDCGYSVTDIQKDHSKCDSDWFGEIWNAIINFFRNLFGLPQKCVCGDDV